MTALQGRQSDVKVAQVVARRAPSTAGLGVHTAVPQRLGVQVRISLARSAALMVPRLREGNWTTAETPRHELLFSR